MSGFLFKPCSVDWDMWTRKTTFAHMISYGGVDLVDWQQSIYEGVNNLLLFFERWGTLLSTGLGPSSNLYG